MTKSSVLKITPYREFSDEDKETAASQPIFHEANKSFTEKIFQPLACCCRSHMERYDLNNRELRLFLKFKDTMIEPYDKKNSVHEKHLELLYLKAFKTDSVPTLNDYGGLTMINEKWVDMGFQGKNPRTDFRGGGYLSLLCLLYFIDIYPQEFDE